MSITSNFYLLVNTPSMLTSTAVFQVFAKRYNNEEQEQQQQLLIF